MPVDFAASGSGSKEQNVAGLVSALAFSTDYNGKGQAAAYMGVNGGGVWRSLDYFTATPTWKPLTDFIPFDAVTGRGAGAINVETITVDPNHPQTMYVGTGFFRGNDGLYGAGILRTNDGGDSWTLISSLGARFDLARHVVAKIIVDPTDPTGSSIYVAVRPVDGTAPDATDSIFKTTNGGTTWTSIGGVIGAAVVITDMEYTVQGGKLTLFAGVRGVSIAPLDPGGVWRSADGGASWQKMALLLPANQPFVNLVKLAADHQGGGTVYAALSNNQTLIDVYKTFSNGNVWQGSGPAGFNPDGGADTLLLSPTGRVYIGSASYPRTPNARGVWESGDDAFFWRTIDVATRIFPHTDGKSFAFGPDGKVYYGNDGGLWRYTPVAAPLQYQRAQAHAAGDGVRALLAGDFNGDYRTDLVAGNDGKQLTFLAGDSLGRFDTAVTLDIRVTPTYLAKGDFNGDGIADVVVASQPDRQLDILLGARTGALTEEHLHEIGANVSAVAVGDFNRDKKLDVVVTYAPGSFEVFFGNGDGTLRSSNNTVGGLNDPSSIAVGDFNNDGAADLVIANKGNNKVNYFKNLGDGTFADAGNSAAGQEPSVALVSGDFNGDGRSDLAVTNALGGVRVLLNTTPAGGGISFQVLPPVAVGGLPVALAGGDLNGDGKLDLVVSQQERNRVSYLLGKGDGTFEAPKFIDVGQNPGAVVVGQFNSLDDAYLDIAVANGTNFYVALTDQQPGRRRPLQGSWANLNTPGLQTLIMQSVSLHPTDQNKMLGASFDNGVGVRTGDKGNIWDLRRGGDGMFVRYDPSNGNVAYSTVQGNAFAISTNGGVDWTERPIALPAAKGAGFLRGHPAQRWARQALFFLVWSCPRPAAEATLAYLAGEENTCGSLIE